MKRVCRIGFGRLFFLLCGVGLCLSVRAAETAEKAVTFEEALARSRELDPATDVEACRDTWNALIGRLRKKLAAARALADENKPGPLAVTMLLNRELLTGRRVTYISNRYWRDSLFTSALMNKRGNCLATSLLYHLAAQELDLPIRLAFAPGHAFVRWDDGATAINLETTAGGRPVTDAQMRERFGLTEADRRPNGFVTTLSPAQIRAFLLDTWAGVFLRMGQAKRAAALLAQANRLAPGLSRIRISRAHLLQRQGRIEPAEAFYRALRQEAQGPWAKTEAALVYSAFLESRGRFDEALELLAPFRTDAPRSFQARVFRMLGVLYRHKRDFDQAIVYHRKHVLLEPDASGYNALGSVLTEAHRDKEAIAAYERAVALNPEDFFPKVILAGLYERTGDREKGRALFQTIQPPREHVLTWQCALVWYYAVIGEKALLLDAMRAALQLDGSGHTYQYFVREPDLDPYRNDEAFRALMQAHAPRETIRPTEKRAFATTND